VQGPQACLPKALAYLAIGLANLALLTLPPPSARARWRSAAAAALRLAYLAPALLLMDKCRLGPGSVVDCMGVVGIASSCSKAAGSTAAAAAAAASEAAAAGAAAAAACDQPWKGVLKLLTYDTGVVFALWYGLMLPLPFPLHATMQTVSWAAVSLSLGRAICNRHLRACEAPAFVRLRHALASVTGALATGAGYPGWTGDGARLASPFGVVGGDRQLQQHAGGGGLGGSGINGNGSSEQGRLACHVVVQLLVFHVGWLVPLGWDGCLRLHCAGAMTAGGSALAALAAAAASV